MSIRKTKISGLPFITEFAMTDIIAVVKNPNTPQAECFRASVQQLIDFLESQGIGSGGLGNPFDSGLLDANFVEGHLTLNHGLPNTPRLVQATIVCVNDDAGSLAGDVIDIFSAWNSVDGVMVYGVTRTQSQLILTQTTAFESGVYFVNRIARIAAISSPDNFKIRVLAWA